MGLNPSGAWCAVCSFQSMSRNSAETKRVRVACGVPSTASGAGSGALKGWRIGRCWEDQAEGCA